MKISISTVVAGWCGVMLALAAPSAVRGQANYAFLACEEGDKILRMSLDEGGYPIDAGDYADASDGLLNPWALAFHPDPQDPSYPDTDHLYVAGYGGGNVVKIIVDRATGDKVASIELGPSPSLRSIAFQPGTNRLYGGAHHYIYKYSEDAAAYETLVYDPARFFDECRLAFHPRSGNLYVATGFENNVLIYDPETGAQIGSLSAYDSETWYLPQSLLFDHLGAVWQLHVAAIKDYGSNSFFSNIRLDPVNDSQLGVGADKQLWYLWNMDKCWATGSFYSGAIDYPAVREISADFSTVTVIKAMGHPRLPARGHLTVATWPPRPLDTDADCISDVQETAWGLSPALLDTDDDGLTDGAEVGHDGDFDTYEPYPAGGDTDAAAADTDGGGEDDGTEIGRGRDPLDSSDDDNDEDGVPNELEDAVGTDRDDPDTDDDGLLDYEEIAWNGDDAEYTPYPTPTPDTNPVHADTDSDGYSDLIEISGGSDPLSAGWTAESFRVGVSFQPPGVDRPSHFATDEAWPYTEERGYGWR